MLYREVFLLPMSLLTASQYIKEWLHAGKQKHSESLYSNLPRYLCLGGGFSLEQSQ